MVHDTSVEPSAGLTLRDLAAHPSIRSFDMVTPPLGEPPTNLLSRIENTWGEVFVVTLWQLDDGVVAAHAAVAWST